MEYRLDQSGLTHFLGDAGLDDVPTSLFHSQVVVTNTVPHDVQKMQCHKIKTVDISGLLTEAIRRIHNQESMSFLFQDICIDD